jgi:hypothetical protein
LDAAQRKSLSDGNDIFDSLWVIKRDRPLSTGISADTLWSYVDGGVFDNSPIRLAFQLAKGSFNDTGTIKKTSTWTRQNQITPIGRRDPGFYYFYISPESSLFPVPHKHRKADSTSIINVLSGALGDWVGAATANELFTLKEEYPDLEQRMHMSRNYYPTFSRLLKSLFGFLESDIRIFDFYLGMYDAQKFLCNDFRNQFFSKNLGNPKIQSMTFDTIRAILECHSTDSGSTNLNRLAILSRELYFQYWHSPQGLVQKRDCAKKFAAAFNSESFSRIQARSIDLVERKTILDSAFQKCSTLVGLVCYDDRHLGYVDTMKLDSIFGCIRVIYDCIAKQNSAGSGIVLMKNILHDTLPLLEHFLEAKFNREKSYLSLAEQQQIGFEHRFEHYMNVEFGNDTSMKHSNVSQLNSILDDISDSTELDGILECLKAQNFMYADIPLLEMDWLFDTTSGKWFPDTMLFKKTQPRCLGGRDVKAMIKTGASKLLGEYSDISGGTEFERNIFNTLGIPLLGFISDSRPQGILYGAITVPAGGEIGVSFGSQHNCVRWTLAANIDSMELQSLVPCGYGLCFSYSVPWYLLVGCEIEFLWKPWIQGRFGLKNGPDFPELYSVLFKNKTYRDLGHKLQMELTISLMERLRISVALATKATTWKSFLNGVTPSLLFGYELFTW